MTPTDRTQRNAALAADLLESPIWTEWLRPDLERERDEITRRICEESGPKGKTLAGQRAQLAYIKSLLQKPDRIIRNAENQAQAPES